MNLSQRLRAFAINDLRRFCSPSHYWLREYDPAADRELTQPLLEKFVSLELTPRELAAAQALGDLATYEISSRMILASTIPVRDAGVPPIETGMTENQEREIAGRFEAYRRSALVYARAVNDDLLIEYFQPPQQADAKSQATHGEASPLWSAVALPASQAPENELSPSERRAQLNITRERGARRRILENWDAIELEYGPHADAHQVLRFLKKIDRDERSVLKTVQNHLSALRGMLLIP
jgi:hypothetical protein